MAAETHDPDASHVVSCKAAPTNSTLLARVDTAVLVSTETSGIPSSTLQSAARIVLENWTE